MMRRGSVLGWGSVAAVLALISGLWFSRSPAPEAPLQQDATVAADRAQAPRAESADPTAGVPKPETGPNPGAAATPATPLPVVRPFTWSASRQGSEVRLSGHVPSPQARKAVLDLVHRGLEGVTVAETSVGDVRGLGVFWAVELVRDRATREPLVPFNAGGGAAAPMNELAAACKERGLWPFTHFNRTHVVPPCTTTADEVRDGLAILDEALTVADGHYAGTDA